MDLALNKLQGLICHKTQPTKTQYMSCIAMTKPVNEILEEHKSTLGYAITKRWKSKSVMVI